MPGDNQKSNQARKGDQAVTGSCSKAGFASLLEQLFLSFKVYISMHTIFNPGR
jgi:hypothetical protein